jgi:hypothetical protein
VNNKRRLSKARQAVLRSTPGRTRNRALKRIGTMAGELAMYEAWLDTKPPKEHVEKVLKARLLRSPMQNVVKPLARKVQ